MLTCILLFMVGLKLAMGTVYFVVLAIAAILCCIKFDIFQPTPSSRRVTRLLAVSAVGAAAFQPTPSSRRVTAKAHKKSARFCSKATDLRRNCRADVHERTAVPLSQAIFAV